MDSANSSSSTERDQSRISVDSIEEWNKVKQNFTESMIATLTNKFGAGASAEKDALLAHLMHWRDQTFELAKPNVRVNGINMEEFVEEDDEEEFEPYDEILDRRLWTHFDEGLSWQNTLATRRRTEPINAQHLMEDLILREREFEADNTPPFLDTSGPSEVKTSVPERLPIAAEAYAESMKTVETWKESLPKLLEKADRMEAVAAVDSRLTP